MSLIWRFVLEFWIGHEIGLGKYSVHMNEVTVTYCSLILPKILDFSILIFEISVNHFITCLTKNGMKNLVKRLGSFVAS